jgi:type II secretory pathway pseudopilin PulG
MSREEGFTLIEALVALVLGAMVVAAVLSTVRIAAAGSARARAATADAEGFARAGTVLAGDAAHAFWVQDAEGRVVFAGQSDAATWPMVARELEPAALPLGPVMVVYAIVSRSDGAVLTRAEAQIGADAGAAVPVWAVPGRLAFRYLDAAGVWQAEWSDRSRLPRAVAVADPGDDVPRQVAALPDLLPFACAAGPDPECPLPAEAFP